jgi:hypothetical protein
VNQSIDYDARNRTPISSRLDRRIQRHRGGGEGRNLAASRAER